MAAALSSGLSIESSVHKPGNVSPMRSAKGAYHQGFLIASIMISHGLYDVMMSSLEKECIDLGKAIHDVYRYGERIHGMGNLHLGFVFLITPISATIARLYKAGGPGLLREALLDYDRLLQEAYRYLYECGRVSSARYVLRVIERVSGERLYIHRGPTPDVSSDREEDLWGLVETGRRVDLVFQELYERYVRTRRIARTLIETPEKDLYETIREVFLRLSTESIDTHIARKKSFLTALIYSNQIAYCLSREKRSIAERERCIEYLDTVYRRDYINPGTLADIVATGVAVRNLSLVGRELSSL